MRFLLIFFCCFFTAQVILAAPAATITGVDDAVRIARSGDPESALEFLFPYLERHHRDLHAHAETISILEWAGRYEDAFLLALSRPDLELPGYAYRVVVRSARRAGYPQDARRFLAQALKKAPEDVVLLALQVHLLADAGQLKEALKQAQTALRKNPQDAELWLALGRVHQLRNEPYDSLAAVQRAFERTPSPYARRELSYALERCGLPKLALDNGNSVPDLLSADEQFRLQRADNAQLIRWGEYPQKTPEVRYGRTDLALAGLDALQQQLRMTRLQAGKQHRKVIDNNRLVALRDRLRMDEVVALYWRMIVRGTKVDDYALQAVADALLYLQQPVDAELLYRGLAERNPQNINAVIGRYYALHEANRYDQASQLLRELAANQPAWLYRKGYKEPEENGHKLDAEILLGLDHLYRNELAAAEQQLTALFVDAPHNRDLLNALAQVLAARQRPRAAQRLLRQGLAIEPQHPGLQATRAGRFLQRRQWRSAEPAIAEQLRLYPREGSSLRLADEWQRHNLRQLEGQIGFGYGDSPSSSGGQLDWLLRNWTRPLDYDWRLAALVRNRLADLPEGMAGRLAAGIAAERSAEDNELYAEVSLADSSQQPFGALLRGKREWNDHWRLGASLAYNGSAIPLRALNADTGGTRYRLQIDWQRDESLGAGSSIELLTYNDGNQRTAFSLYRQDRCYSGPVERLDNRLSLALSHNSQPGGFYFAPQNDLLLEDQLQYRWISWRHYDRTLTQRFRLSSGFYWQQDYGVSLPLGLSYAHEWELLRRRLLLEYGSSWGWREYDGSAEQALGLYLTFSWRY